ncbi:ROK family protein, partial [candidate division KSB1 bacterium]|nr:ROK family protein [candidate division KSB1 bacterium]
LTLPSQSHNLDLCLKTICNGFLRIQQQLLTPPVAISFAFPGPADYPHGIIGDLGNLPAFRGGVALGPMLSEKFGIPVFINNDGDLFAYGEAIAGFLPEVNQCLRQSGNPKFYSNLLGVTLGTGFGGGIVRNGELYLGDNSAAGEIWLIRNKNNPGTFAEEGASIRGIKNVYAKSAGILAADAPEPKMIYEIARGQKPGDRHAANQAFQVIGEVIGDALANAITLLDGLIVIGGGLAGAAEFFLDSIVREMNGHFLTANGKTVNRLESKVFNLEEPNQFQQFLVGDMKEVQIPGSNRKLRYDALKRIGIGLSKLGTSKAVSIGAYAFALSRLEPPCPT